MTKEEILTQANAYADKVLAATSCYGAYKYHDKLMDLFRLVRNSEDTELAKQVDVLVWKVEPYYRNLSKTTF